MRYLAFIIISFLTNCTIAQSRINKLSVTGFTNFYSYGEGAGHLNDVVRLGETFGLAYKTYDTLKNKGMIYELNGTNTNAYYKNILSGNNVLKVGDTHINLNFIFPIFILYRKGIDQSFGVGLGVGTLAERYYFDEDNNELPFNSTNFKEAQFGRYWTTSAMLDYELSWKWTKKIGINVGLRYTTSTPVNSGDLNFKISQGTGLSFKYGLIYQFK